MIVFIAQFLIFVLLAIGVLLAWRLPVPERKVIAARFCLAAVIAFTMSRIASYLYVNPRPFVVDGSTPLFPHSLSNGFPSEHTIAAVVIALVFWSYNKKLAIGLFTVALLIGSARVFANVHHIQDVVGGAVIGILAATLAALIQSRIANRQPKGKY